MIIIINKLLLKNNEPSFAFTLFLDLKVGSDLILLYS